MLTGFIVGVRGDHADNRLSNGMNSLPKLSQIMTQLPREAARTVVAAKFLAERSPNDLGAAEMRGSALHLAAT